MLSTSAAGRTSRASAAGSVSTTPGRDGEVVCLDARGRSNFRSLLFRREWPYFYAFDLLAVDGEDLREWPLAERKPRLRRLIPSVPTRLTVCGPHRGTGERLLRRCVRTRHRGKAGERQVPLGRDEHELGEKIKNPRYTQATGRHELFERPTKRLKRTRMKSQPHQT
jgi:hypothetical protein